MQFHPSFKNKKVKKEKGARSLLLGCGKIGANVWTCSICGESVGIYRSLAGWATYVEIVETIAINSSCRER